MATPYISEIKLVAFNFAPKGWALCNGQLLSIQQNQVLFSLIGTLYGGDGVHTFALPNLQGVSCVSFGSGYTQGQTGGAAQVTLNQSQLPQHTHPSIGVPNTANLEAASNSTWAASSANPYAASPNTQMNSNAVATVGGNQPHSNLPPYTVLNFVIALSGIFPTRN